MTVLSRCIKLIYKLFCTYRQYTCHTSGICMLSMYVDLPLQGVIKLGEKASESKCTLVYGQMNEPPGARARVALTGNVFGLFAAHALHSR